MAESQNPTILDTMHTVIADYGGKTRNTDRYVQSRRAQTPPRIPAIAPQMRIFDNTDWIVYGIFYAQSIIYYI